MTNCSSYKRSLPPSVLSSDLKHLTTTVYHLNLMIRLKGIAWKFCRSPDFTLPSPSLIETFAGRFLPMLVRRERIKQQHCLFSYSTAARTAISHNLWKTEGNPNRSTCQYTGFWTEEKLLTSLCSNESTGSQWLAAVQQRYLQEHDRTFGRHPKCFVGDESSAP